LYSLTYGSDMTAKNRVLTALLASVVDPLIFRTIRTQHQMGYIASGRTGVYPGPAGSVQFRVYIQGNQANPDMMEARLEQLLRKIPSLLAAIPVGEIAERAAGVAASLEEVPTSAHGEVSQFWGPILDGSGCFARGANQAKFLETTDPGILKQGIMDLFEDFTVNRRSKVTVKLWRSENTLTVPPWTSEAVAGTLNDAEVVKFLETERSQLVVLNGISKKDRERAFESAVNPSDPMWDPIIPSCDI
jgi:secreted Zn-dependent insulinase-like peptidase